MVVRCRRHERGRTRGHGRGDGCSPDRTPSVAAERRSRRVARVRADVLQRTVRGVLHVARAPIRCGHHPTSTSPRAAPRSRRWSSSRRASRCTSPVAPRRRTAGRTPCNGSAITALMGVAFLSNQVLEYVAGAVLDLEPRVRVDLLPDDRLPRPPRHRWTAVHGRRLCRDHRTNITRAPAHSTLEVCAFYWHFVDVVWVAMFLTIYVLQ